MKDNLELFPEHCKGCSLICSRSLDCVGRVGALKVVVDQLSSAGATYVRVSWEGLWLNKCSALGKLVGKFATNPCVSSSSCVHHVSPALLAEVRAQRKLSSAQNPGKIIFKGGIQLVSIHVCNSATVQLYTSELATVYFLPTREEVGKKAFLEFHSYLCKRNKINCFSKSPWFLPLVGSGT